MPIWLIEYFGAKDLDTLFIFIALMTAPVWIAMIFFPKWSLLKRLAQPYMIGAVYSVILCVFVWKAVEASFVPDLLTTATYESARAFSDHPAAFLVLFCNFQIINLFLGTMIYQKTLKCGMPAPVELGLCYFFGALALFPLAIRLVIKGHSLS